MDDLASILATALCSALVTLFAVLFSNIGSRSNSPILNIGTSTRVTAWSILAMGTVGGKRRVLFSGGG